MRVLQRSNDRPQRFLVWHFVRCPRSILSPLPTPHGTGSLPYCAPYSSISRPALVKLQRPLRHASRSRMRLAAASPRSFFQSVHDRIRASVTGSFVARSVLGPDPRPPALTLARDGMLQGASALDVGVVSRGKHMAEANQNDRHIRINCAGARTGTRTDHGFISSPGAESPRTPWNPGNS